jgi:8-oxo-dGTP diphosphatase
MTFLRVVVGILIRENKILMTKRPPGKSYQGYWEFPGGKLEENESSKEALVRELHEELGIKVISANLWFQHTHQYPDKHVNLEICLVSTFRGEPYSKEKQTLAWVGLEEVSSFPLLAGNAPIIERIKMVIKPIV